MALPVHSQPPDGYYNGYGLTLYDLDHNTVATAPGASSTATRATASRNLRPQY